MLNTNSNKINRVKHSNHQVFTEQYKSNLALNDESVSGPGSCLARTAEIRKLLPKLLTEYNIKSLLDAPCGDFNWMKHILSDVKRYTGVDIVSSLVEINKKNYSSKAVSFKNLDIVSDKLPKADLIFSRDFLVHLPIENIYHALINFKKSQAKYIMLTTFTQERPNLDIDLGDWRPLNLTRAPFNFPEPLCLINEKCDEMGGIYSDKSLGLWRLKDLPETSI